MAQYGLIKSFDIDQGELDGLSPQEVFVLGYELGQLDQALKLDAAISQPIHADNQHRIVKSCEDAGREYRLNWMPADPAESWMWLEVDPAE